MGEHMKGMAAFLTCAAAGPVLALLAYLVAREPCPPIAGVTVGECVFGMSPGGAAFRFGVVSTVVGVVIGFLYDQ